MNDISFQLVPPADIDFGAVSAGPDGISPTVTVEAIEGGHRVTVTDATHPDGQSFDVLDGVGVSRIYIDDDTGEYVVEYTDGRTETFGNDFAAAMQAILTAAEEARDEAQSAASTAAQEAAEETAELLREEMEGYVTDTQTAATNAENSATTAGTAASTAIAAKDDAEDAKEAAESAQEAAESARDEAVIAQTAAESAQTTAETAKAGAESAKADAESAAQNASNKADEAEQSATDAETAKTAAQSAATEIEDMTVSAHLVEAGGNPTVTKTGGEGIPYNLDFGIPKGEDGASDWDDIQNKPTTLAGYGINDEINSLLKDYTKIVKIDDLAITLSELKEIIDEVNENEEHVLFDFSEFGTNMYLCTVLMGDKVRVKDIINSMLAETNYDGDMLLQDLIDTAYDYIGERIKVIAITLSSNNTAWGTVNEGGIIIKGTSYTAIATETLQGNFLRWENDKGEIISYESTYVFVANDNVNLTAIFERSTPVDIVSFDDADSSKVLAMIEAADRNKINLSDFWSVGDTRVIRINYISRYSVGGSKITLEVPEKLVRIRLADNVCDGFTVDTLRGRPSFMVDFSEIICNEARVSNENAISDNIGSAPLSYYLDNKLYEAIDDENEKAMFKLMTYQMGNARGELQQEQHYLALHPKKCLGITSPSSIEDALFNTWEIFPDNASKIKKFGVTDKAWWLGTLGDALGHVSPHYITTTGVDGIGWPHDVRTLSPFGCI